MVLLAKYLIWPEFTDQTMIYFLLTAAFALLVFFFTRRHYSKSSARQNNWVTIYTYAQKKGLSLEEMQVLRAFKNSLSNSEIHSIIESKRRFYSLLFDYLHKNKANEPELVVRMLDKLFPNPSTRIEIKQLKDLRIGEVCSLDFDNNHHLSKVVKIEDATLLLSVDNWHPSAEQRSKSALLYFYRPGIGGFDLHGTILKTGNGGILFGFNGDIDMKDEQHLMSLLELAVTLKPWPEYDEEKLNVSKETNTSPASNEEEPNSEENNTTEPAQDEPPKKEQKVMQGVSKKISDRAIEFRVTRRPLGMVIEKQDVWELSTTLPDGYKFICRGKLISSPKGNDLYIFRFIDASENARRVLFSVIRENNPKREKIG